jgi:hypothetical protein
MGLSKAIALAHTGVCQGFGAALLVSRFRRPYSLTRYSLSIIGSYFQQTYRDFVQSSMALRRRVTKRRMVIGAVVANP